MLYCFLRPRNAGNVQVLTYSKMACLYNANGIHQHQGKHWPILRNRPKMKKKKNCRSTDNIPKGLVQMLCAQGGGVGG